MQSPYCSAITELNLPVRLPHGTFAKTVIGYIYTIPLVHSNSYLVKEGRILCYCLTWWHCFQGGYKLSVLLCVLMTFRLFQSSFFPAYINRGNTFVLLQSSKIPQYSKVTKGNWQRSKFFSETGNAQVSRGDSYWRIMRLGVLIPALLPSTSQIRLRDDW